MFESGAILLYLAEKFGAFLPTDPAARTEALSWLMWQMGSAPFLGGGFGHFYAYAPEKFEYPINRYAMEVKRQYDVLDRHLANSEYMAGADYSIADMAIWPWYGAVALGQAYGDAATFLGTDDIPHVHRWIAQVAAAPRSSAAAASTAPRTRRIPTSSASATARQISIRKKTLSYLEPFWFTMRMTDSPRKASDSASPPPDLLDFEPVVRKIKRPDGWTPELQREFIRRLSLNGSPQQTCIDMGKHASGIEALYKVPGADSFRAAWDEAVRIGRTAMGLDCGPPTLAPCPASGAGPRAMARVLCPMMMKTPSPSRATRTGWPCSTASIANI